MRNSSVNDRISANLRRFDREMTRLQNLANLDNMAAKRAIRAQEKRERDGRFAIIYRVGVITHWRVGRLGGCFYRAAGQPSQRVRLLLARAVSMAVGAALCGVAW